MVQSPSQKKEIAKVQHQLTDMEKKEAEFKRNAAAAATRYQQACQELGIKVRVFCKIIISLDGFLGFCISIQSWYILTLFIIYSSFLG